MNILKLEKRGMDFRTDDGRVTGSDIGNYRVCTPIDCPVPAKNGRAYFLEIMRADKWNWRKTNKRTGKPLKCAVKELLTSNAAHLTAQFTDEDGNSWGDVALWREAWEQGHPYTERGILDMVNAFAAQPYDAIEYV